MGRKLNELKRQIDGTGPAFSWYLREMFHEDLLQKIDEMCLKTEVYLFSGIIRNYFLKIYRKRDIDIVLGREININEEFRGFDVKRNSFGGYKIMLSSGPLDLWFLKDTWAFKSSQTTLDLQLEKVIPDTAFFNFSSIIFSFNTSKFYYTDAFLQFLMTRTLDYVYETNPNYPLCVVNTFYYSDTYNLKIAKRLGKLVKRLFQDGNYNYEETQIKHFGEVLYTQSEIAKRINKLVV